MFHRDALIWRCETLAEAGSLRSTPGQGLADKTLDARNCIILIIDFSLSSALPKEVLGMALGDLHPSVRRSWMPNFYNCFDPCLPSWCPGTSILQSLVFYSQSRGGKGTSLHFPLAIRFPAFREPVQCRTSSLPQPFKPKQLRFPTCLFFFCSKMCLAAAAVLGRLKAALQLPRC